MIPIGNSKPDSFEGSYSTGPSRISQAVRISGTPSLWGSFAMLIRSQR